MRSVRLSRPLSRTIAVSDLSVSLVKPSKPSSRSLGREDQMIDALISVHRVYADAIISGEKTVELRRRFSDLPQGTRLWLYATKPTAAVLGYATIERVDRARPDTIWKRHRAGAGIAHGVFKFRWSGRGHSRSTQRAIIHLADHSRTASRDQIELPPTPSSDPLAPARSRKIALACRRDRAPLNHRARKAHRSARQRSLIIAQRSVSC